MEGTQKQNIFSGLNWNCCFEMTLEQDIVKSIRKGWLGGKYRDVLNGKHLNILWLIPRNR